LGIKLTAGDTAKAGSIIVRQRGTNFVPGANTKLGRDHTIFALTAGVVSFVNKRKTNYDGRTKIVKKVDVLAS
jgi:large subunit ribosomal protein L27